MDLNTTRLSLRPWTLEDAAVFAGLMQDEGFREFSTFEPLGEAAAREFLVPRLARCTDGYGLWGAWEGDEVVGHFQLMRQTLDDRPGEFPEVGYRLKRSAWGRGLASEGARCLLDYAHGPLGVAELFAFVDPSNVRSQSVVRKLHFVPGDSATFRGFPVVLWSHRSQGG